MSVIADGSARLWARLLFGASLGTVVARVLGDPMSVTHLATDLDIAAVLFAVNFGGAYIEHVSTLRIVQESLAR